jgi:putative peptidoglycan lipid II flippase
MLLPQGVIALSVATALFPTLAELAARGDQAQLRRVFEVTLRHLLFLTLPAAVGLVVLAGPLVRLLLERGAFDAASTALTAWALLFFALGLVGHAIVEILTRVFYALKDTKTPVGVGIAAMVVNIGLSLLLLALFARLNWPPHGGLALANSAAVTLEMAALLWLLRPRLGGLGGPGLGRAVARMGLAAAGLALALAGLLPFLPASPAWLGGLVGVVVGGLVYGGLAYALRVEELREVLRQIARRRG